MACHLGEAFDGSRQDGVRRRSQDATGGVCVTGRPRSSTAVSEQAGELSAAIGLPRRNEQRTGTSILVIDPLLGSEDPGTRSMTSSKPFSGILPRMTETTPAERRLRVEVELEGERVPVPEPEGFRLLISFLRRWPNIGYAEAVARRFDVRAKEARPRRDPKGNACGEARPGRSLRVHHPEAGLPIALMRPVELVVRYIEGEPMPDRRFDWAGVFICSDSDDVEEAFAQAEPPAHDDWIPDNLPRGAAKTYVRVAMRRLGEIARPQMQPPASPSDGMEPSPSLAAVADRMGRLLDRVSARGPVGPFASRDPRFARSGVYITAPSFDGLALDASGRSMAGFGRNCTTTHPAAICI